MYSLRRRFFSFQQKASQSRLTCFFLCAYCFSFFHRWMFCFYLLNILLAETLFLPFIKRQIKVDSYVIFCVRIVFLVFIDEYFLFNSSMHFLWRRSFSLSQKGKSKEIHMMCSVCTLFFFLFINTHFFFTSSMYSLRRRSFSFCRFSSSARSASRCCSGCNLISASL